MRLSPNQTGSKRKRDVDDQVGTLNTFQVNDPGQVLISVPAYLVPILESMKQYSKENVDAVRQKCPKIHFLKAEPDIDPHSKALFPLPYNPDSPLVVVSPKASKPPLGLLDFLEAPDYEDHQIMSKLVVRIYSDPSKPSLVGQHALCVKEGETLPAQTWLEYVGEIGLDRTPEGPGRFYCWDISHEGKTYTLSAYGHGNAAALINGVDGKVLKKFNVKATTVIYKGFPRVFYRTICDIVGDSDISKSELIIDYGNLSKSICGDEMVSFENQNNLCQFIVRHLIYKMDVPLLDFLPGKPSKAPESVTVDTRPARSAKRRSTHYVPRSGNDSTEAFVDTPNFRTLRPLPNTTSITEVSTANPARQLRPRLPPIHSLIVKKEGNNF